MRSSWRFSVQCAAGRSKVNDSPLDGFVRRTVAPLTIGLSVLAGAGMVNVPLATNLKVSRPFTTFTSSFLPGIG
jgi:hypothetical protein